MNKIYGLVLSLIIALVSLGSSSLVPVGSVAIAIILGALIGNTVSIPTKFNEGITYSEKTLLAIAIALMGIHLDFNVLKLLGFSTIFLIIISLIATLLFTFFISRKSKLDKKFAMILGIGNGICGSAAIVATKDILKIDKDKSALAIAIVNLLGTVGLFVLPFIGLLLGLSDVEIGVLLGNTLQSVGHVVAASFGVNETVGQSATIVKMARILLLTPVIIFLIYWLRKNGDENLENGTKTGIPNFIYGFIFFSILASLQILPASFVDAISFMGKIILLIAMSAIGLKISFNAIKESGWEAFVLAGYIFKFQIIFSVIMISIL